MILPLFGFIGKGRLNIGGISGSNGFQLQIEDRIRNEFFVFDSTGLYAPFEPQMNRPKNIIFWSILISGAGLSFWLLDFIWFSGAGIFICFFTSIVGFLAISKLAILAAQMAMIYKEESKREWHSCEHKSVVLLEAGLEPTLENLKKCPALLVNCGTVIGSLDVFLDLGCLLALLGTFFAHSDWLTYSGFYVAGGSFISYFAILFYRTAALIIFPLVFPLAAIPLLMEKNFALKEPPDDKLRFTALKLRGFIELNDLYNDDKNCSY